MKSIKQIIIIRKDLNMRKGKMIAQGAHASLAVILNMMKEKRLHDIPHGQGVYERRMIYYEGSAIEEWLNNSFTKICLYVESE